MEVIKGLQSRRRDIQEMEAEGYRWSDQGSWERRGDEKMKEDLKTAHEALAKSNEKVKKFVQP